ncbi:MAG TPA: ribosome-associated translation inhibitor RaiA [Coriobacteriia bacterium]|nr:ribosome-associated translation inhibitor RaiA [Coriobacteriia bacterium]
MKMIIKGRRMAVTDAIHDYAEEKIGRVSKIFDGDHITTEVELFVEKNPSIENSQVAEVTVWTKGPVIRAKEAAPDMYAAIDLVSEKLERQFRKYKGKMLDRHSAKAAAPAVAPPPVVTEEEVRPAIVKTKSVELKPMTPEEAILQLELLGHDFFVFTSAETETVSVLYRRNDGDYGLIEPSLG